jgi:hypothetical protein
MASILGLHSQPDPPSHQGWAAVRTLMPQVLRKVLEGRGQSQSLVDSPSGKEVSSRGKGTSLCQSTFLSPPPSRLLMSYLLTGTEFCKTLPYHSLWGRMTNSFGFSTFSALSITILSRIPFALPICR